MGTVLLFPPPCFANEWQRAASDASEEEIDRFRRKHMNFQSIRKYYVNFKKGAVALAEKFILSNATAPFCLTYSVSTAERRSEF